MAGLGWQELVIVLVIVIIIFGAGKLPEIGGALGKGIKEFRSNATDPEEVGGPKKVADKKEVVRQEPIKEEL